MLMARGEWLTYESTILPQATWEGRDNLYNSHQFLYPWEGGPEKSLQKTIKGWLELCPGAQELGHHRTNNPIFLETSPKDHREMRGILKRMGTITGKDLMIDDSLHSRFPQAGGSMKKAAPLPSLAQ